MRYTKEQRNLIAKRAIKEKDIAKISSEYGLSKTTIYRYIEKFTDNNNRKNSLSVSLTDKEYYDFISRAKELGYEKNYAHYIRKMLFNENIIMISPAVLIKELYLLKAELNKIGSNLNQLANYTNFLKQSNYIDESYFEKLKTLHVDYEVKLRQLNDVINKTFQKI